jgi:carboxyl-terminal processing protease
MKMSRVGRLSVFLLVLSTLAGGLLGGRVLAGNGRLSDHLRLYTAILSAVEENYADEVKSERLVSTSIREMLHTLDPHSNFLETKDYSQMQERQRGSYYGLGITVQSVDGNITVVSPFEGTPAHRLGIRAGDVISRIEEEDARGMSIDDAVRRLRGPKGTPVRITIVRQGYDAPLEFTVIRDEIPLHAVPFSFMATKKTGYIRLIDFNEVTACRPGESRDCERELEKALANLKSQGATSIILDIRDNPGGLLDQAFAVSNLFLKKGQMVVFTRGRTKRDESSYVTEVEGRFADVPLVLLVSKHSASASEIVAGAVQDHDRALIVGETTFGKGLVQTIMPLRNLRGYALALTTARYYTPSGRSIQRDYGSTALEDYYMPAKERRSCDEEGSDAKLTDAGRKVYGGDGITPDYCVSPAPPSKFVAYLAARQAFIGFSRLYVAPEGTGRAHIAGAGSRSDVASAKVKVVSKDFTVDDTMLADFRAYLALRKLRYTDADLKANREAISRLIQGSADAEGARAGRQGGRPPARSAALRGRAGGREASAAARGHDRQRGPQLAGGGLRSSSAAEHRPAGHRHSKERRASAACRWLCAILAVARRRPCSRASAVSSRRSSTRSWARRRGRSPSPCSRSPCARCSTTCARCARRLRPPSPSRRAPSATAKPRTRA